MSSDSQPVHHERQIIKVVGPVIDKRENYELPSDIDQHVFSKFANIYFKVCIFQTHTHVHQIRLFKNR